MGGRELAEAEMAEAVTDSHRGAFQATPLPWTPKAGPRAGDACPGNPHPYGAGAVPQSQEKLGFCPNLRRS